jgi:dTDP-4-amino-4,6-dideoxygalactose transaminase
MLETLHSRSWFSLNGTKVRRFEKTFAEKLGVPHVLLTSSGTTALITALGALGIGPGDEVIVPPYTFVATINAVLLHRALPVFADTDPATFQIDPKSIEPRLNGRTVCLLPAHIGGSAADLDSLLAIASRRRMPLVEDACQSHLAEWKNRRLGSWGDAGCFSFQASKNLNCGEGGAVSTSRTDLWEKCWAFHNQGMVPAGFQHAKAGMGSNMRITEFQGALLAEQMTRVESQMQLREQNAACLTSMLKQIPGIHPAETYPGCTRNAYHLYMFRYTAKENSGLPRAEFLRRLNSAGIPASGGYGTLNRYPFLKNTFETPGFQRIYGKKRLARWFEENTAPQNDRLCEEAVWFTQNMMLASRGDMERIAEAVKAAAKS